MVSLRQARIWAATAFVPFILFALHSLSTVSIDGARKHKALFKSSPIRSASPSKVQGSQCLVQRGYSGKWIRDWDYANKTHYDIGDDVSLYQPTAESPFRWETSWRWQDDACDVSIVNRDALCHVCSKLNMTRIFLGGDSLTQLFHLSLLGLIGQPRKFNHHFGVIPIPCEGEYPDLSVSFGRFDLDPYKELDRNHTSYIRDNTEGGTLLVLNTGAHFGGKGVDFFHATIPKFFQWIREIPRSGKDLVFVRNTLTGHPQCEPRNRTSKEDYVRGFQIYPFDNYSEWETYFESEMNETEKNMIARVHGWQFFQYFNDYTKDIVDSNNCHNSSLPTIHWLNVFNSTVLRRDGHHGVRNPWFADCLHYFVPGPTDWWVHLWFSNLKDLAEAW